MLVSEVDTWVERERGCDPVEAPLREALHEIRQPLSALFALAECVRLTPHLPESARRYLDQLIEQVAEISEAAASALELPGDAGTGVVGFDEVLDSVLESFALTWTGRLVRSGFQDGVSVAGRRAAVRRCLVNLVDNATRAAGPGGTVVVTVHRGRERVRLLVDDDGPGFGLIPSGAGLGLELSRRTLQLFGGTLAVGLRGPLGGARAVLSLPIAQAGDARPDARAG